MLGVDTGYHETWIELSETLCGQRTAKVIQRLTDLKVDLKRNEWSNFITDAQGRHFLIGTFNANGLRLLCSLQHIRLEDGKTFQVPVATEPDHRYFENLLITRDHKSASQILFEAFRIFPEVVQVHNTNRGKSLGWCCFIHLSFSATLAPQVIFTPDGANVAMREIHLPNDEITQVLHKWAYLNNVAPLVCNELNYVRFICASTANRTDGSLNPIYKLTKKASITT